ncbi:mechanosensitive ion channel family protein [Candidatus Gracilibacteria bacterium]|nr:mechanosensitive ion channel family protein [Candidatus Gracilibacteria bacterium]
MYPGLETLELLAGSIFITPQYLSYLSAGIAFLTLIGFFKIIELQIKKGVEKIFIHYEGSIARLFVRQILNVIQIAKYLLALFVALSIAILPEKIDELASQVIGLFYSLLVLYLITSIIKIIFEKKIQDAERLPMVNASLLPFLKKTFIVLVWAIGLVSIASNLGYNITGVLAGAGVLGLGIGLAAQRSIANIFGAVTIFLNKPFMIGDFVKIGEHVGTVQEISLSYITLSDMTGHDVMIPNENIISSSIENYSKRGSRRSDFSVGIVYDTSKKQVEKAVKIIEEILEGYLQKGIITSYRVNFDSFGDFSLNINSTYFTSTLDFTEFLKEREVINLTIKERFEIEKISMAFPTQEVILRKES